MIAAVPSFGQRPGDGPFDFLNVSSNARVGGLGGVNVSIMDDDVNLLFSNPGLISTSWDHLAAVNYINYYADISLGSAVYSRDFGNNGTWAIGLQYMDLGEFVKRDVTGDELGDFKGSEYFIVIGRSHRVGAFQMGAALKYANSTIDAWSAGAVALDIGGVFIHPVQDLTVGLLIKNIGFIVDDFTPESRSVLPFDVQVGASIKPEHMPFRFSITAANLSKPEVLYNNRPGANNESPGMVDKALSHMTISVEALVSRNFNLRGGYNHLTNKEMRLISGSKGAGFSFGFMLKVKAFEFSFSRALQHAGEGSSFFSLQSATNTFFTKDKKQEN